jgi:hypothetical protein
MLRAIPNVAKVGEQLTRAFAASLPTGESATATQPAKAPRAAAPATPAAA